MKIKSLLVGMFACAALVACSNEDIVEGNGNGNEEGNAVPAYVSLSFTARSNGDGRGVTEDPAQPEDTGVENAGTVNEQTVNSVLYVIGTEFKYVANVSDEFDATAGIYTQKNPIKVSAGEHEVCVVINPCADLVTKATGINASASSILTAIKTGSYQGTSWDNAIDAMTKATNASENANFMMANRDLVKVTATDKNTAAQPLEVSVNVERTVAKIMYRAKNETNTYTVPVTTVEQTLVTEIIGETTYTKAFDQASQIVWVANNKVYSISAEKKPTELVLYNGEGKTPNVPYYTLKDGARLEYDHKTVETTEDLTVTLTGYALTNIQNKMYYVRHTSTDGLSGEAFGLLNGKNYLFDPYFTSKTAEKLQDNTFFFNSFGKYDFAAENAFKAFPTENENSETTGDARNVGGFMAYCYENATSVAMQKHGYSTSVTFRAVATYKDGEKFNACVYNGYIYKSFEKAKEANIDITEADCAIYKEGVCYYTAQIKHLDNGASSVMGNMEFAIVRNNIYSLEVSKLEKIGDSTVDQDPTIDDETGDGYIKLKVAIIPWKVRYNNIEF